MSETTGDDVPRDPWGNPLPPEDRAPLNPRPDDFPPPFPSDPPGGAAPSDSPPSGTREWPDTQTWTPSGKPPAPPSNEPEGNPAWPGVQGPPGTGRQNPAWPGAPAPPNTEPQNPAWPGAAGSNGGPSGGPSPAPPYGPPGTSPGWGQGASQGWGQGTPWAPARNDGMAIGAMVCGIVSITCAGFLGIVLGPVALVLGIRSRRRIGGSSGTLKGEGMALTGIVLGAIGVVASIAYLVFLVRNPDFVQDFLNQLTTTTTTTPGG